MGSESNLVTIGLLTALGVYFLLRPAISRVRYGRGTPQQMRKQNARLGGSAVCATFILALVCVRVEWLGSPAIAALTAFSGGAVAMVGGSGVLAHDPDIKHGTWQFTSAFFIGSAIAATALESHSHTNIIPYVALACCGVATVTITALVVLGIRDFWPHVQLVLRARAIMAEEHFGADDLLRLSRPPEE